MEIRISEIVSRNKYIIMLSHTLLRIARNSLELRSYIL